VNCYAVLSLQRQLAARLPGRFRETKSNIGIDNETKFVIHNISKLHTFLGRVLNKILITTTTLWDNKMGNLNVQSYMTLLL